MCNISLSLPLPPHFPSHFLSSKFLGKQETVCKSPVGLGALIFLPRGNGTTVVSDLGGREVAEPNCGQWEEEYTPLTLERNPR